MNRKECEDVISASQCVLPFGFPGREGFQVLGLIQSDGNGKKPESEVLTEFLGNEDRKGQKERYATELRMDQENYTM